jgi:hypothetical protein
MGTGPESEEVPMQRVRSIDDLTRELGRVTSRADARAVLNRAARVTGVPSDRGLGLDEMLAVCAALAAEGGVIQAVAEQVASASLERAGVAPALEGGSAG